eukprot:2152100-Pyramimonas_sp.AAC.1
MASRAHARHRRAGTASCDATSQRTPGAAGAHDPRPSHEKDAATTTSRHHARPRRLRVDTSMRGDEGGGSRATKRTSARERDTKRERS